MIADAMALDVTVLALVATDVMGIGAAMRGDFRDGRGRTRGGDAEGGRRSLSQERQRGHPEAGNKR